MASKLKGFLRSKKSRSPQPTPSDRVTELSHGDSPQAQAPQNLPVEPSQSTINPLLTAAKEQAPSKPIGEDQNYGIVELYDGGTEASIDIVFVHGLTGNAYNTWLHKDTNVHWPSDLLKQDIPDARILSFGYDADIVKIWNTASKSKLSNYAENMVGGLVRKRERTETESRKIIFIAHSLGGLVVEQALNLSRSAAEERPRQIEHYTAGILFLGVPHYGADLAAWASFGTRLVNIFRRANKDIVEVLEPGSEMLRLVEKGFHNILSLRKDEGSKISITCFYEELPVFGIGDIVPLHSAEIKPYSCFGIHANHMDMTKFPDRNDQGYDAILGELQSAKRIAHREISNNSHSEKTILKQWMIPRHANPHYTGREELGKRLAKVFSFNPSSPPTRQRVFVISGLGGIGKSEVCLKFAESHQDNYWGIFWIDARTTATAEQSYIDIGRRCEVPEPNVDTAKSWLATNSNRWLLIVDNADDRKIDYSEYIPSGRRGDILLSTRDPDCVVYNTIGSETLEALSLELARQLLLQSSCIPEASWGENEKAATAVVEILGSHTLAIIQAGAFIRLKHCTLERYPTIFQQQKRQLLEFHSSRNVSTYGDFYTTFEVSAQHLEKSESREAQDALEFLNILAFMHNDGISEIIFQRAAEYASQLEDIQEDSEEKVTSLSLRHVTRLPEYVENTQDQLRLRKACSVLESLSIISTHQHGDSITISAHLLVHVWAKERQDHESQRKAWLSASTTIAFSCQGWYIYCPFFILLQPQVRACVNHDIKDYTRQLSEIETAQLLFQLAYVLYAMRDDNSLDLLVQKIRSRLQDRAIIDNEIAFQIAVFTGRDYENQGKYLQAISIYSKIVEYRSQTLAEDHPSRLASQHNLAGAYEKNGQIKEAIQLLEHVLKVREKLAVDHPDRLGSQHNLASAYQANGQVDEAIQLLEHVVKVREKLAEDHPSRLSSQHNLAGAYQANGQIEEAIQLLKHVVKIREKLAEDHPLRLISQHNLASAYQANGQVDEAIQLLEHVVEIEEKLAEDHPSRLASQIYLVSAYRANGQVEKAADLSRKIKKK